MKSIAVISKPQKQELFAIIPELLLWLRAHRFRPVLDPVSGVYSQDAEIVPREALAAENPELAIVLGGDGTLLAAARALSQANVPLLSVNLGSLGFLTEVALDKLYPTLEGWLANQCHIEERSMLCADLVRGGQTIQGFHALNDVVISKAAIARMAQFSITLDSQPVAAYRADGVIVATPTGSTAYSLAANGPILSPEMRATVITPVCPHLLTIRPLVVPAESEVRIAVEGASGAIILTIDGQEAVELQRGDQVVSRRSSHNVKLVRLEQNGFFNVLKQKLKWGER